MKRCCRWCKPPHDMKQRMDVDRGRVTRNSTAAKAAGRRSTLGDAKDEPLELDGVVSLEVTRKCLDSVLYVFKFPLLYSNNTQYFSVLYEIPEYSFAYLPSAHLLSLSKVTRICRQPHQRWATSQRRSATRNVAHVSARSATLYNGPPLSRGHTGVRDTEGRGGRSGRLDGNPPPKGPRTSINRPSLNRALDASLLEHLSDNCKLL